MRLRRYRVLDTYRFLAASGIILYHFESHFRPFMPDHVPRLERFQCFVDFFFVLSGFVLMHTYGRRQQSWSGHKDFLWKRFARLYPLHVATILLSCLQGAIVIGLGLKVRDPSFFDVSLVPSNLLLIQAWGVNDHPGLNSPSWSLSAEAFVYILFPALVMLVTRAGAWTAIALAILFMAATVVLRARLGLGDADLATYDFGNVRALPAFIAGMAVCAIVDAIPVKRIGWMPPNLLASAIVALMLLEAPTYAILALFPLLVGMIAMAERGGAKSMLASDFFVMLGNASFAIYLTHSYVQAASVSVVRKLGWTSPAGLVCIAAICFVLIVGASVLSYLYFETPLREALLRHRPTAIGKDPRASVAGRPVRPRAPAGKTP